jgi:VanZ family protein
MTDVRGKTTVRLRWALVVLVMLAIFIGSAIPGSKKPKDPYPGVDKQEHFIAYALLALTLYGAVGTSVPNRGRLFILAATIAIAATYGITDEFHQRLAPGREFSIRDWRADIFGASTAAFTMHLISKFGRRKHERR